MPSTTPDEVSLQTRAPPWQVWMPTWQTLAGVHAAPPLHCEAPPLPDEHDASDSIAAIETRIVVDCLMGTGAGECTFAARYHEGQASCKALVGRRRLQGMPVRAFLSRRGRD